MTDPRKVIESIAELPTLPTVVARINDLVNSANASAGDINDVISRDLALSSRVLKLVNSSFYGFPRRITSITHAVVILGFNTVRNLVLSAFVFESFNPDSEDFEAHAFWRHSIGVGVTAQAVAQQLGKTQAQKEDAFIAGLLHGVGKVVMAEFLQEEMQSVLALVRERDCLFIDAENEVLDYNHAQLGAALLEAWNLPVSVVSMVRHHHGPVGAGEDEAAAAMVHVGDVLARAMLLGNPGDHKIPPFGEQAWSTLGLTWAHVEAAMDRSLTEMQRTNDFLEMI